MRTSNDHRHEMAPEPESEVFEDGAFIATYRCMHRPVYGSYHDDTRDEVYYDEGPQCDRSERDRYDLKRIEVFEEKHGTDDWVTIARGDDVFEILDLSWISERFVIDVEESIRDDLCGGGTELQVNRPEIGTDRVSLDASDEQYVVYYVSPDTGAEYRLEYRR